MFEFDRCYPQLADLTPKTVVITRVEQAREAADVVGLPAFVKGSLLSFKHLEWASCVADTLEGLEALVARLLKATYFSRGRVLVRELVGLKRQEVGDSDIPAGREFRLFVHGDTVVGCGYYWGYLLPFSTLEPDEEQSVFNLALEAASRLTTPFISFDIGQLEDDRWIVIETGDPQFSGLSLMPERPFWQTMCRRLGS